MLQAMLDDSLGVPKAQRHAYQESVADMAGEVLREMEEKLRSAADEAQAAVEEANANKARREAARLAAETNVHVLSGMVDQRRAAKQMDDTSHDRAVAAVAAAEASLNAHDAAIARVREKQHLCSAITSGCSSESKVDEVELRVLDFDKSLAEAAELSLRRDVATRSQFDTMVLEELERACVQKASELEEDLATKEIGRADLVAASEAASRAASATQAAVEASARLLGEAVQEEAEGKKHEQSARCAVRSFLGELRAAADMLDLKLKALADFRAGPLAAFSELEAMEPRCP